MPTYPSISVTAPGATLPFPYAHCTSYFAKGIDASGPFYNVRYYVTGWANSDDFVNQVTRHCCWCVGTGVVTKRSPHQHRRTSSAGPRRSSPFSGSECQRLSSL